ncbi:MAG: type II toxin-antitoxin system RelE/ParE family toxin [Candidatus Promineofilum sp.]|nr:type II toxin-antitoxin system RelE/ParE family toxin [Promineifilum sp.]MCW5863154.1 type II toxin-antitoxin system RelE/ParE family toxin [Anaerolineae bacterium]
MVFIETSAFTKRVVGYLTDDEYLGLQMFLLERPDAGQVVQGTGGVRKLRWAMTSRGKSGGLRVIYYWRVSKDEIWLLTMYSKNERENISSHILKQIAEEIGHD